MSTLHDQFSQAGKAQVETQLDFVRQFSSKLVESTEQVLALNLSTSRASFEQSADGLRKLFAATSPRELIDLSARPQAGFDTLLSYGSQLFNIATQVQTDLLKSVNPAAILPKVPAFRGAEVNVEVRAAFPSQDRAVAAPVSAPAVQVQVAPQAAVVVAVAEPVPLAPIIEVTEEVPVPGDAVQANPLAQAVSDTLEQEPAPVLAASPLITGLISDLNINGIEPVAASAPHAPSSGNPMAPAQGHEKPPESGGSKSRKKR